MRNAVSKTTTRAPESPPPEAATTLPAAPLFGGEPVPKGAAETTLKEVPGFEGPRTSKVLPPPGPAAIAPAPGGGRAWRGWLVIAWAAGALAALLPYLVSLAAAARMRRSARTVTDGPWAALLGELAEAMGVGRRPALLVSGRAAVPMASGLVRPAIVLPESAEAWPDARRRVVLLHELAHVRRLDLATRALAQAARAIHWFNPLVYLAARRLDAERERACDDLVLAAGMRASEYAAHLVEIARGISAARRWGAWAAAVPMAEPSRLEDRVHAILDAARSRAALKWWAIAAGVLVVAAVVVPLAAMRAGPAGIAPDDALHPWEITPPEDHAQNLQATLTRFVTAQSDPDVAAWTDEGGPAVMRFFGGVLVVNQTPRGHERVAEVLGLLDRTGALKADTSDPFIEGPEPPEAAATRALLQKRMDLDFQAAPLPDVLSYVAEVSGLNIVADPELANAGIDLSARTLDLKMKQATVAEVLGLALLSDVGCRVGPGYVLVTTRERAQRDLPMGLYRILWFRDSRTGERADTTDAAATVFDKSLPEKWRELADLVQASANSGADRAVAAWADEGGPAQVQYLGGVLLVTQTRRGHERVAALLSGLARKGALPKGAGNGTAAAPEPEDVAGTRRLLDRKIDADFVNTGLDNVLRYLDDVTPDLAIRFDPQLAAEGIELSSRPITLKVRQVPVGAILDLVLGSDLAPRAQRGAVLITTRERAWSDLVLVAYPIGP
jgi:beta-lactamase regulating signal transducer with metallopeptidase domain